VDPRLKGEVRTFTTREFWGFHGD